MRGRGWGAVLVAGALVATGCVGTTSRDDFEAEIRSRGGGMRQELVIDAVEVVGRELGDPAYDVHSIVATPSASSVVVVARGLGGPDDLDAFTVHRGEVSLVTPQRVPAGTDVEAEVFPVTEVHLDRLDEMVDQAHAGFDADGSWVASVVVRGEPSEDGGRLEPVVLVQLESDRAAADARFTADGRLVEVERR